jgi:hypothetical protein
MTTKEKNVQWYWKNDQDVWVPYSEQVNAQLEKAYQSKQKQCPVDDERFVDIPNLLQRRKDDISKCRLVNRDLVLPLEKYIFVLLGKSLKEQWTDKISKAGGLVTDFITNKVRKETNGYLSREITFSLSLCSCFR